MWSCVMAGLSVQRCARQGGLPKFSYRYPLSLSPSLIVSCLLFHSYSFLSLLAFPLSLSLFLSLSTVLSNVAKLDEIAVATLKSRMPVEWRAAAKGLTKGIRRVLS